MEEAFIVTRRRRRSANGAGPEPAGPSTSNARESSDISHAALPNDPNFSLYQGEIEGVEPEVTVEEFLRWSAAGASTSTKRSRKTRRFVNLTEPSRDLVQFSEVEHVVVPPTRKRRRALPQLPASDDEYQPSEDEQQGRPVRKRKTYKGKGRSLSRRMLHAAVLSHVDVGPNSFPTGAPGRQPLKFAAVDDADASPPPAILNAHKLRLIDSRSTTLQPSVFGKRLVSVAKNPLTKPRFNYRIPSPLRGSSSTQAAKSVPNSRKGCDNQRAQEFVTNRKEASASPLRRQVMDKPLTQPVVYAPIAFVPLQAASRYLPRPQPIQPTSPSSSFVIDLCSDDGDEPHCSPLHISSSPSTVLAKTHNAANRNTSTTLSQHTRGAATYDARKDMAEYLKLCPNKKLLKPLGSFAEAAREMTRREVERQKAAARQGDVNSRLVDTSR